jgi:23S rRNA (guanine745-N1)-methyltransferase
LDIGCGDGFFLDQVASGAQSPSPGVGIDVSKGALAKAAKSYPNLLFVRGDASRHRLPFKDASFGLALSIFAPRPIDEIRRVLSAGGSWIIVTATQDHLKELRDFLPLASIGTGKLEAPTGRAFAIRSSEVFERPFEVSHPDLVAIVEMSPSIHRLRREGGDAWCARVPQGLRITFSFSITLLGKDAP